MADTASIYLIRRPPVLTTRLQPSSVCDEAVQSAMWWADHLGEDVGVKDPTHIAADEQGRYTVHPDGSVTSGWDGDWPEDRHEREENDG